MSITDNTEHIKLSDFIKSIHKKLREEAKVLGTEQAWETHCKDTETLERYASAMQQLAVNHWDKNSATDERVLSRIFWVYYACKEYYTNIDKHRDKELKVIKICYRPEQTSDKIVNSLIPLIETENRGDTKYRLLDVGSCYNPFKDFQMFEVVPIDIAPASKDVLKCDFLNLDICGKIRIENQTVLQLKEESFDIIVFSLLLEYFPNPEQRLKCCLNAYKLLKFEGILAIVTPDSNHVGSRAKIIKSWQYVLAKQGFIRIKYEKLPYIHCMIFRKASFKIVALRWAEIHESGNLFEKIFIPQDFTATRVQELEQRSIDTESNKWDEGTFLQDLDLDYFNL